MEGMSAIAQEVYGQLRKPSSIQRKIARALSVHNGYHEWMTGEEISDFEKSIAKVVKRVINAHNKGK